MNKLILLACLMLSNVYANKNWININTNNGSSFKMYKPSSSYNKYNKSRYKKKKKQGIKLIDNKLLNSIRHVKGQAKKYR